MRMYLWIVFILIFLGSPVWGEDGESLDSITQEEEEEQSFIYNDHGKRDPFWKLVDDNGSVITYDMDFNITDLSLEGIMLGRTEEDHIAIINGRIVKKNANFGKFVIKEIMKDSVVLTKDQQKFELRLKKED